MTILVWSAFTLMAVGVIIGGLAFRRLVEIEFSHFHDQWLKDGRPVGGRGSRKAASFWRSGFSTYQTFNCWLIDTPAWVQESPKASASLRRFRLWTGIMMVGVLTFIGIALLGT